MGRERPESPPPVPVDMAMWKRFPVDAPVRPLVFPSGLIAEPPDGYTTDDAKLAAGSVAFNLPATSTSPATLDGYDIVPTADALTRARADGTPPGQSVTATDVQLGHAEFMTDRGPKTVPAWLVSLPGATAR
jgi:hypothetical protein